jgi:hypothetical protein
VFTYGSPFEIKGDIGLAFTEAVVGSAHVAIGNFTIYDTSYNLLLAGATPDADGTIVVMPEPRTWFFVLSVLSLLALLRPAIGSSGATSR